MKTTFIYSLIDPRNGKLKYIGKANDPKNRATKHLSQKYPSLKTNWVAALRNSNLKPILEIIDEVPYYEWEFWEQHYISLYKSWGFDLLNMTNGGDGVKEHKHTKEAREKISNSLIGNKRTFGYKHSEEFKKKISNSLIGNKRCVGRKLSDDHKRKISESMKAYKNK